MLSTSRLAVFADAEATGRSVNARAATAARVTDTRRTGPTLGSILAILSGLSRAAIWTRIHVCQAKPALPAVPAAGFTVRTPAWRLPSLGALGALGVDKLDLRQFFVLRT
jgi:hypothetical protein